MLRIQVQVILKVKERKMRKLLTSTVYVQTDANITLSLA